MKRISITTIEHKDQRYPTCGDWITEEEDPSLSGQVQIKVSKMEDPRMEFLVVLHELIEWFLAEEHGVRAKDVTMFDTWWETLADASQKDDAEIYEPGDHPSCPVYHEHRFATAIERIMAHELNVEWRLYERAINELFEPKSSPETPANPSGGQSSE